MSAGDANVANAEEELPQIASKADRKAMRHHTAKKGFSKYISPRTELIIGVFVLIMICSPAIFFSISLSVPYYTLNMSKCNTSYLGLSDWGLNANPIPPQVFYSKKINPNIGMSSLSAQMSWLVDDKWTLFLSKGVCPNGKSSEWPKYCLPYNDPAQPELNYPGIWTMIDLENQLQLNAGLTTTPVYSDMTGAARNFKQAFGLSVLGCIMSWVLILYTIYAAIHTDIEEGHAGMKFQSDGPKKNGADGFGELRLTFTVDKSAISDEDVAKSLVEKHADHPSLESINPHALHRMVLEDDPVHTVTYTSAIAIELAIYLTLFGLAASVIRLLAMSDMVDIPDSWKGFFATCSIEVTPSTGIGILFYQCISMGLYTFALLAAELYYACEYLAQCMHNVMTHPDERTLVALHQEKTGAVPPEIWTGPVFLSRIHLTKVRAIQRVYEGLFGESHVLEKDAHKDAWVPPPANMRERTMQDVHEDALKQKAAKKAAATTTKSPIQPPNADFQL